MIELFSGKSLQPNAVKDHFPRDFEWLYRKEEPCQSPRKNSLPSTAFAKDNQAFSTFDRKRYVGDDPECLPVIVARHREVTDFKQ